MKLLAEHVFLSERSYIHQVGHNHRDQDMFYVTVPQQVKYFLKNLPLQPVLDFAYHPN
jgi:hypothetical protein